MRVGVIGLGSIGSRHAKNLINLGHNVLSHDPNVPSEALDRVIHDSEAVVIASPTRKHIEHSCMVRRVHKPAFIEKPLGYHLYSHLFPCMVGYNLRFHPCVRKTKEWLPRIGKILWANFTVAQFNAKPAYMRDGVILNWSHEIDLALYLLGNAEVVASSTKLDSDAHDVMTDIILRHENDCRSTIHMDYVTAPERRYFTIVGENGRITCCLPERNVFMHLEGNMDWYAGKGTWDDDYLEEMKAFVDMCGGKETPGCTCDEAIAVMRICLEVRRQAGL